MSPLFEINGTITFFSLSFSCLDSFGVFRSWSSSLVQLFVDWRWIRFSATRYNPVETKAVTPPAATLPYRGLGLSTASPPHPLWCPVRKSANYRVSQVGWTLPNSPTASIYFPHDLPSYWSTGRTAFCAAPVPSQTVQPAGLTSMCLCPHLVGRKPIL